MRLILIFAAFWLSACQWQSSPRPSVLVIAVGLLGAQDVICEDQFNEAERGGFNSLCLEGVRFTHAYSTSPQGQAAMASLMTGFYPDTHGVWHNGSQFVSGKLNTVAEAALHNGFRTSFFSGGPPIWSKSGLRQGFEFFDDNFPIGVGKIYRPVMNNFELFLRWLDEMGSEAPFFSVIYLADLEFAKYPTQVDSGESRKRSVQSQIAEVDESLAFLFKELRKRKRWNSTHIVMTGLTGRDEFEFRQYVPPENVFSENLQVALLIKTARKNPEQGGSWKIDRNVSLADVGATLYELVESTVPPVDEDKVAAISLVDGLREPQVSWPEERLLLAGSGWPSWLRWGENRLSLRSGYFLLLLKTPLIMFNTLTDKLENVGQKLPSNYWPGFLADISKKTIAMNLSSWTSAPKELITKLSLAKEIFSGEEVSAELKQRIMKLASDQIIDQQVLGWAALRALEMKDWEWLLQLSQAADRREWQLIALHALGEKMDWQSHPCLGLYEKSREEIVAHIARNCEEPMFKDLLFWLKSKDGSAHRDAFIRDFQYYLMEREIATNNYQKYLAWDVDPLSPKGPAYSELILALPENKKFLDFVQKRISQ